MTWGEFCEKEKLSSFEKRHLGEVLIGLRRKDAYTGAHDRKITYREMLEALRHTAYYFETLAGRESNEDILRIAEATDAAANLVLAILINLNKVKPILHSHGQRMGAHRQ